MDDGVAQEVHLRCTETGSFIVDVVLGESKSTVSAEVQGLSRLLDGEPVHFDTGECMGVMMPDGESVQTQLRCRRHIEFSMPLKQFSMLVSSIKQN